MASFLHLSKVVTSNKMVRKKMFYFLAHFFITFHVVFYCKCWPKNQSSDWIEKFNCQSEASILCFLKLTLAAKRITPYEGPWNTWIEDFLDYYHAVWGQLPISNGPFGKIRVKIVYLHLAWMAFSSPSKPEHPATEFASGCTLEVRPENQLPDCIHNLCKSLPTRSSIQLPGW